MKFKCLKMAAISVVLMFVGSTQAALITDLSERDWQTSGDGLLTYDASTGLEWLDLTHTTGNSILDTEAESFYGEFRWATHGEIEDVLDAALNGTLNRQSSALSDMNNVRTWQSLFGITDGRSGSNGVSRGSESILSPGRYGLGNVRDFTAFVSVSDPLHQCCWTETQFNVHYGAWLVRATSVPEPSIFAIFTLGILGLSFSRFKK